MPSYSLSKMVSEQTAELDCSVDISMVNDGDEWHEWAMMKAMVNEYVSMMVLREEMERAA